MRRLAALDLDGVISRPQVRGIVIGDQAEAVGHLQAGHRLLPSGGRWTGPGGSSTSASFLAPPTRLS